MAAGALGVLAAILLSLVALLIRVKPVTIWLARLVAIVTIVSAGLGVWQHFDENYNTAPLDAGYSGRWHDMSTAARMWAVSSGSVGHVPVLAAGAMVPIGATLAVATMGLSALAQDSNGSGRKEMNRVAQ